MLSQLYPQARWPNMTGENYSLILCGYTVVKMCKPDSILRCRLPAKSNRKGNQICDGELTHLKCWRQNRTLHPKHTQKIMLDFMICRMFVQHNETRRDDALMSREEEWHLKSTASSNSFVCIESGADIFAEKPADSLFDSRDSHGSSNNLHRINVIPAQLCHKTHAICPYRTQIMYLDIINQIRMDILDWSRTAFSGCSTLIRYWADMSSKWPLWKKQYWCIIFTF